MQIYKSIDVYLQKSIMNTFDIIITALLLFGFIRGLFKGLFLEIASFIALIAGIYGAMHFSYYVKDLLIPRVTWEEKYSTLVAFVITFIVVVLVITLIGKLFTKIADFASLGILNKLLGGIFGTLKVAFMLSLLFLIFNKLNNKIPFLSAEQQENAVLYEPLKNLAPNIFPDFVKVEEPKEEKGFFN